MGNQGINRRDIAPPRTPADIDRKYQARFKALEEKVEQLSQEVTKRKEEKSS